MEITQWLTNEYSRTVWKEKYQHNEETLDEWFTRVSGGNPEVEEEIRNKRLLFAGRTLSNRGTGNGASYSNCYTSGRCDDSLDGIMNLNKNLAMTYKSQGGQGVSLTNIRPKGAPIKNGLFISDGIIPFMQMFDTTTKSISQAGSRKGALMMSIDAEHKDIIDFLNIKTKEGQIEKANLSLEVSDAFMNAVDKYYETGETITIKKSITYDGGSVDYEVTPIDIYKRMMDNAWDWGEPGIMFMNRFRNYNIMELIEEYVINCCNPCFTGDMKLLTANGYKTFEELSGLEVEIVNSDGDISTGKVWETGEKDTIALKLSNKDVITCTPDHIFMLNDGTECQAKDTKGKRLKYSLGDTNNNTGLFFQLGFIQGDGSLSRLKSKDHKGLEVYIGENDSELLDIFLNKTVDLKRADRYYVNGYNDKLKELGFSPEKLPSRVFPIEYSNFQRQEKLDFLKGCYSANGCVIKNHRISYKTTCLQFAKELIEALSEFNISSYITTNKPKKVLFSNGEYLCKESYDINISRVSSMKTFYSLIGFIQGYKIQDLSNLLNNRSPKVLSITENGTHKVYDFSEPLTHWGIVNGVVVHNCGEQPLPDNGACCLLSINASEFVVNEFTDDAYFSIDKFKKTVEIAVVGINEVLDEGMELHALLEQRQMAYNWRNVGIGIMGIGDVFAKMGISYASKESIELLDKIMRAMFRTAVVKSSQLAVMYSSFPKYDSKVFDSEIIKSHFSKEEIESLKSQGLRNCSLLSIAPTGSIGSMLNVTTGIEPAFAWSYKRKTESLHGGDKEVYYDIFTGVAKEYMNKFDTKELPSYFVASSDVYWKDRIDLQSVAQRHVDTAISSTVNLPYETPKEEVEQLYLYAWKKGLKGITIFRDGCKRASILTTGTIKESKEENENTFEFPWGTTINVSDDMIGRKRKIMSGCGAIHVQAWFDPIDGRMMEVFLAKGSTGGCNSFMLGLSRMTSLALRTGANFDSVIDQLNSTPTCPSYAVRSSTKKDTSKGNCCPTALGYALRDMQYEVFSDLGITEDDVYDAPKTTMEEVHAPKVDKKKKESIPCPKCGEPLIFEGGCQSCISCSWTKCE